MTYLVRACTKTMDKFTWHKITLEGVGDLLTSYLQLEVDG